MADYLIDRSFRDARNALAEFLGFTIGMAAAVYAVMMPSLHADDGASIVSDGSEAGAMNQAAYFSLEVEFVQQVEDDPGQTSTGRPVTIRDGNGKAVIAVLAQGPRLRAALPPGTYTVEAVAGERTVSRVVNIQRARPEHLTIEL